MKVNKTMLRRMTLRQLQSLERKLSKEWNRIANKYSLNETKRITRRLDSLDRKIDKVTDEMLRRVWLGIPR